MSLLDDDGLLDLRPRGRATDPAAALAEEGRRDRLPQANAALRAWPAPTPADARAAAVPDAPGRTGAPSLCALCGTRPSRGDCALCGRAACAADLWVMLRLCRACADDDAVARGQRGARPEASNWLEQAGR